MIIAGGLYRETCVVPEWNAEYGSGGRAAAAVVALSPATVLHTYSSTPDSSGLDSLRRLGVDVRVHPASHGVAFAYFHPLSNPHIVPPKATMVQHPSIEVFGEAVLRFGFLEGDAIVRANRAVYDPQTSVRPAEFGANGSHADELALVLNEGEARALSGSGDMREAALTLLQTGGAAVVVIKAGAHGALVAERGGTMTEVPAYRSARVFKIGTGDVFSSMFALEWAERKQLPAVAADLASRSVADYCSSGRLPLPTNAPSQREPILLKRPPVVLLEGAIDTIGRRYVMEEARYSLAELGAIVVCPALEPTPPVAHGPISSALVIADAANGSLRSQVQRLADAGIPVVLLDELRSSTALARKAKPPRLTTIDDFTSAIYFALWAASPQPY
jgi:hypothetical protein